MKFIKSKEGERYPNYFARVINVTENMFSKHPNPEVTALKRCRIGLDTMYNVIVGINSQPDKYVFFPAGTQLNPHFLYYANLYRKPEMNKNPEAKPGLFEDNGRVKSVRLKGTIEKVNETNGKTEKVTLAGSVSDGFLIELQIILDFILDNLNILVNKDDIKDGIWFDTIEHNDKSFWISKKYIIKQNPQIAGNLQRRFNKRQARLKKVDKIIEGQFNFHYDTVQIAKMPFVIQPDDYIHISSKWHGKSAVFSYVLCNKQLTWKEKIAKWLTKYNFPIFYDYLYASRNVIRNRYILEKTILQSQTSTVNLEEHDLWSEAFKVIKDSLWKGMTIYAEIVGYEPDNTYIQKGYDYGCIPMKSGEEYTYGKHFKIMIYRITLTNPDGYIHEFSPREVQIWCNQHNLKPVIEYYYGKAKDLYPDIDTFTHWHENFWERMADDKNFYMEMNSPDCNNKVPHEGVVIKIDDTISRAFKLKCFAFLKKEQIALDKGESNVEDEQSEQI